VAENQLILILKTEANAAHDI